MKGQTWITQYLSLLVTGVLVVGLVPFTRGQATKIIPEVQESEFENKALIFANSLLANLNLMQSDDRAVFAEDKLDSNMMKSSATFASISDSCYSQATRPAIATSLCNSEIYPGSFSLVLIKDAENQKGWFVVLSSPNILEKVKECLKRADNERLQMLFNDDAKFPETLGLDECGFERISFVSSLGLPVSIKYKEATHAGWLKVLVVE